MPLSKSVQQIVVSLDSSDDESSDNDPFSFVRGKMSKELIRNKAGKNALNKTQEIKPFSADVEKKIATGVKLNDQSLV